MPITLLSQKSSSQSSVPGTDAVAPVPIESAKLYNVFAEMHLSMPDRDNDKVEFVRKLAKLSMYFENQNNFANKILYLKSSKENSATLLLTLLASGKLIFKDGVEDKAVQEVIGYLKKLMQAESDASDDYSQDTIHFYNALYSIVSALQLNPAANEMQIVISGAVSLEISVFLKLHLTNTGNENTQNKIEVVRSSVTDTHDSITIGNDTYQLNLNDPLLFNNYNPQYPKQIKYYESLEQQSTGGFLSEQIVSHPSPFAQGKGTTQQYTLVERINRFGRQISSNLFGRSKVIDTPFRTFERGRVNEEAFKAFQQTSPIRVFRGDTREPQLVFYEGFKARGRNYNVHDHKIGGEWDPTYTNWIPYYDSGYVATSDTFSIARKFPKNGIPGTGAITVYVYVIDRHNLWNHLQDVNRVEREIMYIDSIPAKAIVGAYELKRNRFFRSRFFEENGSIKRFYFNPFYKLVDLSEPILPPQIFE